MEGFPSGSSSIDGFDYIPVEGHDSWDLDPVIEELYESMGIDIFRIFARRVIQGEEINTRLNALYVQGIQALNAEEVFSYFKAYGPSAVEIIDDDSCVVEWEKEEPCARAVLDLTKPLPSSFSLDLKGPGTSTEFPVASTSKMEDEVELPPEYAAWRLGEPHPRAPTIVLRFATKDDKPGVEKKIKINHFERHGNSVEFGLKSEDMKPPESVLAELRTAYPEIRIYPQRQRYIEEFNEDYDEYLKCRQVVKEMSESMSSYKNRIERCTKGSREYVRLVKAVSKEHKNAVARGYDERRQRYEFLRAKLEIITKAVEKFDREIVE